MKMLSKEKCEKAIDNVARYCSDYKLCMIPPRFELTNELEVLMDLIKEHFELVEKYEENLKYIDEQHRVITRMFSSIEKDLNPKPYKFEELKKGMWVWDDKGLYCFECNPAISTDMAQCVTYNAFWYNCGVDEEEFFEEYDEFEEGRFFPVTKAMEYQK